MTEFRVWAPKPALVRLDVDGAVHPMTRSDDGWWHASVDAPADARYGYLLDDDPKPCCPTRDQPVNPMACTSARSCGTRARRPGPTTTGPADRSKARSIYELHVGTFTQAGTFDSAIEKLDYLVDFGHRFRRADAGQLVRRHARLGI